MFHFIKGDTPHNAMGILYTHFPVQTFMAQRCHQCNSGILKHCHSALQTSNPTQISTSRKTFVFQPRQDGFPYLYSINFLFPLRAYFV